MRQKTKFALFSTLIGFGSIAQAGQLALVIDDFGYRPQEEYKILKLPAAVSIAVLPDAPYSRKIAELAHQQGHEILIHLPMAPLSKQPLEKNTLTPEMSAQQVAAIIARAVVHVPYAVGLNNHMGSRMTSSLSGMQKVMQALQHYNLYFLDSVTIGNTQAERAAAGTGINVLRRQVFLDDVQNIAETQKQFQHAVQLARRNGYAIAIGHPHPTTVKVLQQELANLPSDITLVRPSQLIGKTANSPPQSKPLGTTFAKSKQTPYSQQCRTHHPQIAPTVADAVLIIYQSVKHSRLFQDLSRLF